MTKCIIVDDEPLALDILESYIAQCQQLQLVQRCRNALEAFDVLHSHDIGLMFLDIQMPSINGVNFIRSLKEPPKVIFTTAYPEYAVTGFELDAVDYLLKPVTFERFEKSLAKFFKIQAKPEPDLTHTYFKVNGKLVKLEHADIISAQSIKDYIIVSTAHGNYVTHMTMKYLATLLPADKFYRVHRSFIVGAAHITAIGKNEISLGETVVPVGENYKAAVDQLLTNLKSANR